MNIIPKISDMSLINGECIDDIMSNQTMVEIQLSNNSFEEGFARVKDILQKYSDVSYCIMHLPFNAVHICYINCVPFLRDSLIKLVVESIKYSNMRKIHIDILFHLEMQSFEFKESGGFNFLKFLVSLVEGTNVGFLLENSIINVSKPEYEPSNIDYVFENFVSEKLKYCLDLCHFQASENVMKEEYEISETLIRALKNIHFSATLNNDGFKNKKTTHGRVHENLESCINDLKYLEKRGIDLNKVNLVAEISEENYFTRDDLRTELGYLKRII